MISKVFLFSLFIVTGYALGQDESAILEKFKEFHNLTNFDMTRYYINGNDVKTLCEKNGEKGSFEKLVKSYAEVVTCLNGLSKPKVECSSAAKAVECLEPIFKNLGDCLPSEAKYLPQFILDAAVSLAHHLYDDNCKNLNTIKEKGACLKDNKKFNKCLLNLQKKVDSSTFPTKSDLCDELGKVQDYISELVDGCESEDVKTAVRGVVDAIDSPCSGNNMGINQMIMILSLFVTLKKLYA